MCVGGVAFFLPTVSSCLDRGFWRFLRRCHPFYFSSFVAFPFPYLSWSLLKSLLICVSISLHYHLELVTTALVMWKRFFAFECGCGVGG